MTGRVKTFGVFTKLQRKNKEKNLRQGLEFVRTRKRCMFCFTRFGFWRKGI